MFLSENAISVFAETRQCLFSRGLLRYMIAFERNGSIEYVLAYSVECIKLVNGIEEEQKGRRTPRAISADKNSIEFTVVSVTVTVSDSCSSRCGSRALDSILWRRIAALESFHATPIPSPYGQSGYRIFQLKNPFIPDLALSENGAIRRYSLQWTSGR